MSQAAMSWDLRELEQVQRALNKAGSSSLKPMLNDLAMEIEEQTRERFQTKTDPDGDPWEDWSERYKERLQSMGKNSSILQLQGYLEESITHDYSGSNGINARVRVGSPLIYSASPQYGDDERGIPERAFLGINAENEADLVLIINDHLAGKFGG